MRALPWFRLIIVLVPPATMAPAVVFPPAGEAGGTDAATPPSRVFRFVEAVKQLDRKDLSRGRLVIVLEPPQGGAAQRLAVPNTDPSGRFSPPDKALRLLRDLPGETLIVARLSAAGDQFDYIGPFDAAPGEASPRGFIFRGTAHQQIGKWSYATLELEKFRQRTSLLIPNRTAPDGRSISDTRIMGELAALKPAAVVEVWSSTFNGMQFVEHVEAYLPPRAGVFLATRGATTTPVATSTPATTTPATTMPAAIEVQTADGRWTLELPRSDLLGRAIADPLTAFGLNEMRPGTEVTFTMRAPSAQRHGPLRDLALAGRIWRSQSSIHAQSGAAGLIGFRKQGTWIVNLTTFGREEPRQWLKLGLARALDDADVRHKLGLRADQEQALRDQREAPRLLEGGREAQALDALERWRQSGGIDRAAAEQHLFRLLQAAAADEADADAAREKRLREVLSAGQVEQLLDLGKAK
jgi:hypothetical protein